MLQTYFTDQGAKVPDSEVRLLHGPPHPGRRQLDGRGGTGQDLDGEEGRESLGHWLSHAGWYLRYLAEMSLQGAQDCLAPLRCGLGLPVQHQQQLRQHLHVSQR